MILGNNSQEKIFWQDFLQMVDQNPDKWRMVFGTSSEYMQDILDNVTNSIGLDRMYDWPTRKEALVASGKSDEDFVAGLAKFFDQDLANEEVQNDLEKFIMEWGEWFWQEMVQTAVGIRLRKENVFQIIDNFVEKKIEAGADKIRILSLASGKGYEILEVLKKRSDEISFEVVFTDIDERALAVSKSEYEQKNINQNVVAKWIQADLLNPESGTEFKQQKWDLITLVGFMDYLPDEVAVKFAGLANMLLNEGGAYLTGSVVGPSGETNFLEKIIHWRGMHYRSLEGIKSILVNAGFATDKIEVVEEATNTHRLLLASK